MSSRRLLVPAVLALLLIFSLAPASAAENELSTLRKLIIEKNNIKVKGDVTGDYMVNNADLVAIEASYWTDVTEGERSASDLNGDGTVNILDLKTVGMNYGSSLFESSLGAGVSWDVSLYVQPVSSEAGPGEEFDVNINLDTPNRTFAAHVMIGFDEDVIIATNVVEGNFLNSDGASTWAIPVIDNVTGIVSYDITRFETDVGVSGDGTLFTVTFRGEADGISPIKMIEYSLVDDTPPFGIEMGVSSVENGTAEIHTNRAPVLSNPDPSTPHVMNEGESQDFTVEATDPEGDDISYKWELDDAIQLETSDTFKYSPGYSDSGPHAILVNVSDGKLYSEFLWEVTVNDVPITCYDDSDCGTDGYITDDFCSGDEVVRTYRTNTCNNPGLPTAYCSHEDEDIVQHDCTGAPWYYKCVDDECVYNQPPSIDSYSPINSPVTLFETETQGFSVTASDPYDDDLDYSWTLNGSKVSTTKSYTFVSDYDSAGTYDVLVSVSDGKLFASHYWQLLVLNVNRAPVIGTYIPGDLTPDVDEGKYIDFSITASDPDNDGLSYEWRLDGDSESTSSGYRYSPGFEDAGPHTVYVKVSDNGGLYDDMQWDVTVNDISIACTKDSDCGTDFYYCSGDDRMKTVYKCNNPGTPSAYCSQNSVKQETCDYKCVIDSCVDNQPPVITYYSPSEDPTISEEENQGFTLTASDPYGDQLSILWTLNGSSKGSGGSYTFVSDYDSAGTYIVVAEVSDGELHTDQSWLLTVTNVNRPPKIDTYSPVDLTPPAIDEGKYIDFSITASDPDNDGLSYLWKLDGVDKSALSLYTYSPGYDDSGTHTVEAIVSDGIYYDSVVWTVTVNDVTIPEYFEQQLFYGYNTVQLPSAPADTAIESVLSSVEGLYNTVLVWDEENGIWLDYVPGRPDHFNSLHELDETRPFHIDMKQNALLKVQLAV